MSKNMELVEEDFSSLAEHVMKKELYKQSSPVCYEGCSPDTEPPFALLSGESSTIFTRCNNGANLVVLTNYRLFVSVENGFYSVPLGLMESIESSHPHTLVVLCKDCRSFKVFLETEAYCRSWLDRLNEAIKPKSNFRDAFAFVHFAYRSDIASANSNVCVSSKGTTTLLTSEYQRLGMGQSKTWRITECNTKYSICSSYPKLFIVPRSVTDRDIEEIAKFRSLSRVPSVVWRHSGNGCVIVRCSQPLVGVLGWRCQEDEKFFNSLAISCVPQSPLTNGNHSMTNGHDSSQTNGEAPQTNGHIPQTPNVLILDLRSYASALGNRAKGGGCEHPDYYPDCEIRYKGLPNIHSVRKSFISLRTLLSQNSSSGNFLSMLEATQWMSNISQILNTSVEVVSAIHGDGRPVVVHCSDGWDRTSQIVALAEILLDPYYRTFEGFQTLVEREWLSFGHKFFDRTSVEGEQSPIFLQWLDCVHQLMKQFPTAFEFNISYLIKLVQYSCSLLSGTFLLNFEQQRGEQQTDKHTVSVWTLLNGNDSDQLKNVLYKRPQENDVVFPSWYTKDLYLWRELYCTSYLVPYSSSPVSLPLSFKKSPPVPLKHQPSPSTHVSSAPSSNELTKTAFEMASTSAKTRNESTIKSNSLVETSDWSRPLEEEQPPGPNGLNRSFNNVRSSSPIQTPQEGANDMEDSFRVIEESPRSDEPIPTPPMFNTSWSNILDKMDMSALSECECRLRNLSDEGMKTYEDSVQVRVREIEEELKERIRQLEAKVHRLTASLSVKNSSSSNGERREGDIEYDEKSTDIQSSVATNLPISPGSEWTHITMEDTKGVQWVPDYAVKHCNKCGAEFWLGKRKHHCRNCGGVFCWKCSSYSCPVPKEQLFGNQRVCRTCFDRLDGHLSLANQSTSSANQSKSSANQSTSSN